MDKNAGTYLGTIKDDKWWDLYTTPVAEGVEDAPWREDEGKWWVDDAGFHFFRQRVGSGLDIPLAGIQRIELVRAFASRWSMAVPILKITWTEDGLNLSSGFVVSERAEDAEAVKSTLEEKIAERRENDV